MICGACQNDVHPVKEMFGHNGVTGTFVSKCPRHECGAPMPDAPTVSVGPSIADELAHLRIEESTLSGMPVLDREQGQQLAWVRSRIARLTNPAATPVPALAVQPITLASTGSVAPESPSPRVAGAPVDFLDQVRSRLVVIDEQIAGLEKLKSEARKLRAMLAAADAADAN